MSTFFIALGNLLFLAVVYNIGWDHGANSMVNALKRMAKEGRIAIKRGMCVEVKKKKIPKATIHNPLKQGA